MAQISKPLLYGLFGVVVVAAVLMTQGDSASAGSSAKKKTKSTKSKLLSDFTDEDYTVKFDRLQSTTKNSFKPVIVSYSGSGTPGAALMNSIPSALAGGDPSWSFTGVAVVDGERMALVENSATQEGDYIKVGQAWKTCKVVRIEDTKLVLMGDSGDTRDVNLNSFEQLEDGQVLPGLGSSKPVNPLKGPIGSKISVTPLNRGANSLIGDGTVNTNANE